MEELNRIIGRLERFNEINNEDKKTLIKEVKKLQKENKPIDTDNTEVIGALELALVTISRDPINTMAIGCIKLALKEIK